MPLWGTGLTNPGGDLLSPSTDYHRPRMLNGRVRDGNGCDHPGVLTGNSLPTSAALSGTAEGCMQKAAVKWLRDLQGSRREPCSSGV